MNHDIYSLHIYWKHIQNIFEEKLSSGLSGSEEEIVRDLYEKLRQFYTTATVLSDKVDKKCSLEFLFRFPYTERMKNNNVTHNCPQELELWIDNDSYLNSVWRKTIRTGNLTYIKDAFEEAGFTYREDQWEHLVDVFESELAENERALEERNVVRDMHGNIIEDEDDEDEEEIEDEEVMYEEEMEDERISDWMAGRLGY